MKQLKKTALILLLATGITVGMLPVVTQTAYAGGISYKDCYWDGSAVRHNTKYCSSYTLLQTNSKSSVQMGSGWYVAWSAVTLKKRVEVTGNANLIIADGQTLTCSSGIYIHDGCTLTIYAGRASGMGSVEGSGKIVSNGSGCAGIGGKGSSKGGNLVIHGGNITATGPTNNAGIGGGEGSKGGFGDITIYGGTVNATGGSSGAGIGRGEHNDNFGTVKIYGGTVNATGGDYGAGIGGGESDGEGSRGGFTTEIYGGTVNATGGKDGAGIGGGEGGDGGKLTINGGTVTAKSTNYGAGIGSGEHGNGGSVTINGGTVTATGGEYGAGIGGGKGGTGGNGGSVTINGGTVTATGGSEGAGIGGGTGGSGGTVNIGDCTVTATGGKYGAGIGGGNSGSGGTVNINGGTVTAKGSYAAGIGCGDSGNGCTVNIRGGDVTTTSGYNNPTIGGNGRTSGPVTINISGGKVTAINKSDEAPAIGVVNDDGILYFNMTGGTVEATVNNRSTSAHNGGGAGLGGRWHNNVTLYITISGGTLTAKGGAGCAGIGSGSAYDLAGIETGGDVKSGSYINISGDNTVVKATGGINGGAGIGAGKAGNQKGTITISGGTVEATGNGGGAGIGGGKEGSYDVGGNAGTIKITGGTVTATANDNNDAQAIGHGADDGDAGSLTIGDKLCVKYGSNTAGKDDRVSKCREHGKRIVDVCEHSGNTYNSNEDTHTQTCRHCKSSFSAESHTMDDSNKCKVCGYQGRLYTVSFEAGGGSGSMSSPTVVPGKTYTLPAPEFTAPEGKAFEAWTVKVGSEDKGDLLPGSTITVTANTTVTAKWSDKCKVAFEKGNKDAGGSMEDEWAVVGSKYTIPECGFTAPAGKIFKEWSVKLIDDTDLGNKKPGEKVDATTHMTLTAVWADSCTVTINAGEKARGDSLTAKVEKDSKFRIPTYRECDFTASDGYAFDKWSVKIGDAAAVDKYPDDVITVSANTDVTAVWKEHVHSFTYTSDGVMITATCSNTDKACQLDNASVSLTINKPALNIYGGAGSAAATLSGLAEFKEATGLNVAETDIRYAGRDGTTYDESEDAPTDAGKYAATITAGGQTASVDYEIAKADPEYMTEPSAIEGLVYNGKDQYLINPGVSNDGNVMYGMCYAKTVEELKRVAPPADYSATPPKGKADGFYIIWYYIEGSDNYNQSGESCLINTIRVGDPSEVDKSELPSAVSGLRYDGREHELMDPPEKNMLSDGVYFAYYHQKSSDVLPDDAEFFEDIPTETEAGDYYVWFTIGGDPIGTTFPKMGPFCVTIDKADARTLDDVTVDQPRNKADVSVSVAGLMPDDANVQSYNAGEVSKPENVAVSGFMADGDGNVTAEITGGKAGDTVTLPVTIGSTNYLDSTVNIVVDIGAAVYKVTVNNGEGDGTYAEGSTVTIKADVPAPGTKFKEWTGTDGLTFTAGGKTTPTASFTMPSNDVTAAAAYKDLTSISGAKVVLSADSLVYNGKVRTPSVKTIGGMTLTEGTDYTVSWTNASSKDVGKYGLLITGKGDYIGTTDATYKIIPKGTSLKRLVREKKAVTVNWKKQSAKMSKSRITGYQIQLATDKKFTKNKKTVTVKGYKKTSKKVKKLKGKKKYYVRIRTYKTVSGSKFYSAWSKTKAVKTR